MTALLEVRTASRDARIATRADRRRFGRRDESRTTNMHQIRERIERDTYAVDPQKVAEAIVRRLLAQPARDGDQCE
jgi:anti-sigma28 factor (negative regulator of flagellin synthesis)